MAKLTEKQKRFCDNYIKTGNATDSYKLAYPKCKTDGAARASSCQLLTNPNIKNYIEERNIAINRSTIADMTEIKEFWTNTVRNKDNDYKDRLKASELIGKTNAAFTDKVELAVTELPKIIIKRGK